MHGIKSSKTQGTQAFKAVLRPKIEYTSTGGHLALKYFNENYDSFLKKSPKVRQGEVAALQGLLLGGLRETGGFRDGQEVRGRERETRH